MNIILFGPPAAGKGTQAKTLAAERNMLHLSTGDLLREAIASRTALGIEVETIVKSGGLVSDSIVIDLIAHAVSANQASGGVIFDGFPRTLGQAEALDALLEAKGTEIARVVRLKVDEDALMARVEQRFLDQGRPDDNPEAFRVRLAAYNRDTAPLLPYYQAQAKLHVIDGMGEIEAVALRIEAALTTDAGLVV